MTWIILYEVIQAHAEHVLLGVEEAMTNADVLLLLGWLRNAWLSSLFGHRKRAFFSCFSVF